MPYHLWFFLSKFEKIMLCTAKSWVIQRFPATQKSLPLIFSVSNYGSFCENSDNHKLATLITNIRLFCAPGNLWITHDLAVHNKIFTILNKKESQILRHLELATLIQIVVVVIVVSVRMLCSRQKLFSDRWWENRVQRQQKKWTEDDVKEQKCY